MPVRVNSKLSKYMQLIRIVVDISSTPKSWDNSKKKEKKLTMCKLCDGVKTQAIRKFDTHVLVALPDRFVPA